MNKRFTLLGLMATLALGACGTTGGMPPESRISNGEYHLYVYPGGLPHVEDSQAADFGVKEGDQLVYLDRNCREQMAKQLPGAMQSVLTTTARTALPTALLGGLGTAKGITAVAKGVKGYGTYGAWSAGGSAAGSGLGGGIDRHLTGNRYAQAGCMNAAVTEAKRMDGALKGIDVVFNADAINGRSLKRPTGPAPTSVKSQPDASAEAAVAPPQL